MSYLDNEKLSTRYSREATMMMMIMVDCITLPHTFIPASVAAAAAAYGYPIL